MTFPSEIYQLILGYSDFLDRIKLTSLSKYLHKTLKVYDFCNIKKRYLKKLTNDILYHYPYITKLDIRYSLKVNDDGIKRLRLNVLYANKLITDEGIKNMKLEILHANKNRNITNDSLINMKKSLKKLYVAGNNKITSESVKDLDLEVLDVGFAIVHYNKCGYLPAVTDDSIRHMKNLKELYICGNRNITNNGIKDMNLKILNANCAFMGMLPQITDDGIRHMDLEELYIQANTAITDEGIKNKQLKILYANLTNITDYGIKNMDLKILYASSFIIDNGIRHMNLKELYLYENNNISNSIKNMKLNVLDPHFSFNITDNDIISVSKTLKGITLFKNCNSLNLAILNSLNLTSLNLNGITDNVDPYIKHMTNLKKLYLYQVNSITDEGIKNVRLKKLVVNHCNNISNKGIKHMELESLTIIDCNKILCENINHKSIRYLHIQSDVIKAENIKKMINLHEICIKNSIISYYEIKDMNIPSVIY